MFTVTATKNLKRRLDNTHGKRNQKVQRIMSTLPDRLCPKAAAVTEEKPDVTLQNLVKAHPGRPTLENPSYADLPDFFHAPTQAEIDAYQHDILQAVRTSQVDTLRKFHAEGRPMKCSNEFGESILHLACRKGLVQVAEFLINEAKVPVQVCDDYGRNPLHDACWVSSPNFALMDLILGKCPDLLFIKDRRGHTPLSFAGRNQWQLWNHYLKSKTPDFLTPKYLLEHAKNGGSRQASAVSKPASLGPASTATAAVTNTAPAGPATAALGAGSSQPYGKISMGAATAFLMTEHKPASGNGNTGRHVGAPIMTPKVAAKGIKIPCVGSATGLSVLLNAAALQQSQGQAAAPAPALPSRPTAVAAAPGPASVAANLVAATSAANSIASDSSTPGSVSPSPATAALHAMKQDPEGLKLPPTVTPHSSSVLLGCD